MKKLLLASTALVLSAGVASAQGVTLSGDARMGIVYDGNDARELGFTSRARVTFTLSGETDGGLAFGASFRADNAAATTVSTACTQAGFILNSNPITCANTNSGGAVNGAAGSVFISGDFGRLTMGDTSGAAEFIVGDLHGVGLTGLGDQNEMFYISNSPAIFRPTARYDYTLDGLKLALSIENPKNAANYAASIAASYTFDAFTAGLGYEREATSGGANHLIGFVAADIEGINAKAIYGRANGGAKQYGVSVSGSFDATTVTAFARRDFATVNHYGMGASYDLGGGASLKGGIVKSQGSSAVADFGLAFTF